MYSVYTGGRVFRAELPCSHEDEPPCLPCRRMAVSMISAYQLSAIWSPADTAATVLTESIPLEDLVDPQHSVGAVWDVNLKEIPPGPLRDFLLLDQDGPLEVARRIFQAVCQQRSGAFSAASAGAITLAGEVLFPDVPEDTGHFRGPYYRHFLQGLRTSPPEYVRDLQRSETPDDNMAYVTSAGQPRPVRRPRALRGIGVDGVVLVTL